MREFLLRLLGAPCSVHIHFDKGAVATASPGDLVVVTCGDVLRPEHRQRVSEFFERLRNDHPQVKFVILEPPLSGAVKGGQHA